MKKFGFKEKIKVMSKKKKIILLLCLAAVIALIIVVAHSCSGSEDEDLGEEEVMTATAETMTITKKISSNGEIISALEEKKTPHATYKLEKINVTEGQGVKEGSAILTYTNGQVMAAPYDCVVLNWNLPDLKQTLTNDHSVTIAGTDVLMMELEVNEDEVFLIKRGNPATIKVKSVDRKYKGEVSYISDIGDYSEGMSTFKVRVTFDNDGALKLGMNGKARITLAKAENVIAVPVDAVYEDGETNYVTVLKGDEPEEVEVETGLQNDEFIEIKSGLKEGDVVQYMSYEDEWEEEEFY